MDNNTRFVEARRLERVKKALEGHNMAAHIADSAADVVPLVTKLLPQGATVSNGGSMTLYECGVMDALRSGPYQFLDREAPGVDQQKLYRQVFSADCYLASANAVTETGEIYQIDGNGNRIAPVAFGPGTVILVVGRNKIVPDLDAARVRNARVSGPANAQRVQAKAPCVATGQCTDCQSPGRICNMELVLHHQKDKGRIQVILVNDDLGY